LTQPRAEKSREREEKNKEKKKVNVKEKERDRKRERERGRRRNKRQEAVRVKKIKNRRIRKAILDDSTNYCHSRSPLLPLLHRQLPPKKEKKEKKKKKKKLKTLKYRGENYWIWSRCVRRTHFLF